MRRVNAALTSLALSSPSLPTSIGEAPLIETFDNGVLCSTENSAVVDEPIVEWLAANGYFYVMHRFDVDNVAFAKRMRDKRLFVSISSGVKPPDYAVIDHVGELGAVVGTHGGPGTLGWLSFSAIAVGIGTSLVLDEFALILHLQDVYWSGEGQLSVEAVSLVAACLGLALVGFSPLRVPDIGTAERLLRISATGILVIDAGLALVCILKGKYRSGLFGLFLPPVGLIGAVRLAGGAPGHPGAHRGRGYQPVGPPLGRRRAGLVLQARRAVEAAAARNPDGAQQSSASGDQ